MAIGKAKSTCHDRSMMKTATIVNINGSIVDAENAMISVFDRGFLFGDSVYEVTMTVNNVPFMIEAHIDRLENSAHKIALPLPKSRSQIITAALATCQQLNSPKCYMRIICTRGVGEITLDPTFEGPGNLIIIAKELPLNPLKWYSEGVWVVISDVLRNHKRAMDPSVKSGNYLNNVMAMGEAKRAGAFDAIMLNHRGNVTEGTTSNIWIVEKGSYITPPLSAGLLGGITRQSLLDLGAQSGLSMYQEDISPERLKAADEVFLTSTTKEIVPIVKIDQSSIGSGKPGEYTRKLHAAYQELMALHFATEKKRLNL